MKHGAAWAVGFFGVLFFLSTAFAAYSALQTVGTASSGSQILSAEWNKMVSNFASVDSQLAALGSLSLKSSVATADIADSAVASAKIADSAVTDAKIASGISPSKLASGGATSGQVLSWNGSAWAPAAAGGGAAEYKAIMNAAADHVYSAFGLWGPIQTPFTQHYTNTANGPCGGGFPAYPAYPNCPTGWISMGTRQTQTTDYCTMFGESYSY